MDTLIIGCGYLGLTVAKEIQRLDPSAKIVGTTRTDRRHPELIAAGVNPILLDVAEKAVFDRMVFPPRIVHCVGFDRSSIHTLALIRAGYLRDLLLALAGKGWTGRFVYVSSTGIYGQVDGSWVDEDSPAVPTSNSGRGNLLAESALKHLIWDRESQHPVTIRLAGLYGPGRIIGLDGVTRGDPIQGDPERWLNLIHVEDAARAVVAALIADAPRELYLACDDRPVKRREYYETLAQRLGAPAPRFLPGTAIEPDKRVRNTLMREELGVIPEFPDFLAGLDHALWRE